jgi:hypothetical protein
MEQPLSLKTVVCLWVESSVVDFVVLVELSREPENWWMALQMSPVEFLLEGVPSASVCEIRAV